MRKIILLTSLIAFNIFAFAQDSSKVKSQSLPFFSCCYFPPKGSEIPKIIIRCGRPVLSWGPLYIIDGVVASIAEIRKIDPDNIDSLRVFKGAEATALYGSQGMNGVVVITTKKTDERIIEVRDKKDGNPLPFATIEITRIGKWRTDRFTADSLGKIKIKTVHGQGYELVASYVGYKNPKSLLRSKKKEKQNLVYLEKASLKNVKLYPNPVLRLQQVGIEFENSIEEKVTLKLFSSDGKLIGTKEYNVIKGVNKLTYAVSSQLVVGTYIIQLTDNDNTLIRREKLIIR